MHFPSQIGLLQKLNSPDSRRWNNSALSERISSITFFASADRQMIEHMAPGVGSTAARARIPAFKVDAGQLTAALGTQQTLWPTARWRANVIGQT